MKLLQNLPLEEILTLVTIRLLGLKARVGFKTAGAILTLKAHHLLEKHVLSKYQLMIKSQMADWYGTWLRSSFLFVESMRDIEN